MIITEEAQGNGQKETGKDLLKLIVFGILCVLPFLQDRMSYQMAVEKEMSANQMVMTIEGYAVAKTVATSFYGFIMTDLGVYRFINLTLKNEQKPQDKFEAFWAKFLIVSDRIVDNLPLLIYQIGWRVGVATYWIIYFVPFFAASVYGGIQHWKLSLVQSSGAKIERFKFYRHMTRFTALAFILYLLIPTAGASSLAQYLVPAGLFLFGVMLNKMISNYHKMV
ncbi:DUF4400 domain-containing protein [Aeromonas veronii]|uniref:DUF4400 domain-containing protein n=1 Tax=Aeromonas veronii TaxID=654 RepID=UPI000E09357F|nr:DUF4400 domain-containing protein [Aeromonas veronii]RDE61068.1 DUF4400 domain-containing protein [Aeromonas veronii]